MAEGYVVSPAGLERITHGLEDVTDDLSGAATGASIVLDCLPKGAFGGLPESGEAEAAHARCAREAADRAAECANDVSHFKTAVGEAAKLYQRTEGEGAALMGAGLVIGSH